jgi:hypothetical protein
MEVLAVVLKLLAPLLVTQITLVTTKTLYKIDMPLLMDQRDAMKQLLLKSKGKIENGSYYNTSLLNLRLFTKSALLDNMCFSYS